MDIKRISILIKSLMKELVSLELGIKLILKRNDFLSCCL